MSLSGSIREIPDPRLADGLSGAERRLAMLQRLGSLGMRLAEEVTERAINSPYHPEAHHEPARAFAAISRAVRLTIVLEARVEAEVFALRKGEVPYLAPVAAPRTSVTEHASDHDEDDVHGGGETVVRERTYECLVDRAEDETLLDLPFDDCVEVIRKDLGLTNGARSSRPRFPTVEDVEKADETCALRIGVPSPINVAPEYMATSTPAQAGRPRPRDDP